MKRASDVRVGIPADDLLKLRGRSIEYSTKAPTIKGKDDEGLIVAWHYADGTAEIRRRLGMYRVVAWSSSS